MMDAYARAMAATLAIQQAEQRAMLPRRVAQKLLGDFCGRAGGFGAVMDFDLAAELVRLVEAVVIAERALNPSIAMTESGESEANPTKALS